MLRPLYSTVTAGNKARWPQAGLDEVARYPGDISQQINNNNRLLPMYTSYLDEKRLQVHEYYPRL